jgi:CxC5 like cysteine cluster associated with KDZ transposases
MKNVDNNADEEHITAAFGLRLDAFAKPLGLHPYDNNGEFQGRLNPVSHKTIQPVHVLCPIATECETQNCNGQSLLQNTATRDIPDVTLIKNSVMYKNVPVLTGQCSTCQTKYFADHEWAIENDHQDKHNKVYLNSAKYLKVGQNLWVDRLFSNGVVNGMYSFHASAAAYTEYWNDSFWKQQSDQVKPISRRQVWQAFTQETICSIAAASNHNLILSDNLKIDEVTKEAFDILGNNGLITAASNHSCSECTHEYKQTADTLPGENVAQQANIQIPSTNDDMEVDKAMMTMVVLDGIVIGPTVG